MTVSDLAAPTTDPTVAPLAGGGAAFASLTFPRLAWALDALPAGWVAVGATVDGKAGGGQAAAGLALGMIQDNTAHLLSLTVAPGLRRRGIGRRLARAWEASAVAAGATALRAGFSERLKGRAALAATLAGAGWSAPRLSQVWAIGETGPMVEAVGRWPAVAARLREPDGFTFDSWDRVGPADAEALAALAAEPDCLPHMPPRLGAERIEPLCSIAVRRHGALVGWVLGERTDRVPLDGYRERRAIYYRSAYLARPLWHSGVLVGAYWHAYARQAAAFGPESVAMFCTVFPRMMALVRRRFAPISLRVDETHEITKFPTTS